MKFKYLDGFVKFGDGQNRSDQKSGTFAYLFEPHPFFFFLIVGFLVLVNRHSPQAVYKDVSDPLESCESSEL